MFCVFTLCKGAGVDEGLFGWIGSDKNNNAVMYHVNVCLGEFGVFTLFVHAGLCKALFGWISSDKNNKEVIKHVKVDHSELCGVLIE